MEDLCRVVGLDVVLGKWGIDPDQNFEDIFSTLHANEEADKLRIVEDMVEDYFSQLELADSPTIYDRLVLSLRGKDIIATFNWDPLLLQSYVRSSKTGLTLPKLAFLHGNVGVGFCESDRISGPSNMRCGKCGNQFQRTRLLYPIRNKDYASDPFVSNEWQRLRRGFESAFMITIFGYSGPKTDEEALKTMKGAWGDVNDRSLEQTSFITLDSEDEIVATWEEFIHTHHYDINAEFNESWIANHPRRTVEAFFNQFFECKFIDDNPIPEDVELEELWGWFGQFRNAEEEGP